jgi:hypothetical protein
VDQEKVVGKVGRFNICVRQEQLTSPAGTILLHDFAQRLGVAALVDQGLHVKTRERGYEESKASGGLVYTVSSGGSI